MTTQMNMTFPAPAPVRDVRQIAVERAVSALTAAGAQFKVLYGGAEYGDLLIATFEPPKPARPKPNYVHPRGAMTDYLIAEGFDALQIGSVLVLNGTFTHPRYGALAWPLANVASGASARGATLWGKGAVITHVVRDAHVEVLRQL